MLKVGAENVAASEIERVIMETGLVAEVAVVGRPDDQLDEVPVAFVVPWQRRNSLVADVEAASAEPGPLPGTPTSWTSSGTMQGGD